MKSGSYSSQNRGGVGKKFMTTKEDDSVSHVIPCTTHDEILFFTNNGRVFIEKVYNIPEYGRTAKGQALVNLINLDTDELVTSILTRGKDGALLDEDIKQEGEEKTEKSGAKYKYLFMATKDGVIKKTSLSEFANIRTNGLIAIKLSDKDQLRWVKPTSGNDNVILVTKYGRSIRFIESDVRPTGRDTMGVRGIKFKFKEDEVISADVIRTNEDLMLTVAEKGFGKTTPLEQFPLQKRGGQGVFAAKITDKTGVLAAARIIDHPDLELLIMSHHGQAVRIKTKDLPKRNRQTSGVKLMRIKPADKVGAIAII
jgi:DNA gyrase subunit A